MAVEEASPSAATITNPEVDVDVDGAEINTFTEDVNDYTIHIQIIRLHKQIFAWVGCNTPKFGHLYAAAPTTQNSMVSVASILGGASDNTGLSMARRLVLKTGLNVVLACSIPKNSPMLEADAERILVQKLTSLGYVRSKSQSLVVPVSKGSDRDIQEGLLVSSA